MSLVVLSRLWSNEDMKGFGSRQCALVAVIASAILVSCGASSPDRATPPTDQTETTATPSSAASTTTVAPTTSPPVTTEPPGRAEAKAYLSALISEIPEERSSAATMTVPESPAAFFTSLHVHAAVVGRGPQTLRDEDQELHVCYRDECAAFSDFQLEGGKIRTFKQDGAQIEETYFGAGPAVTDGPLTLKVLAGRSIDGALQVAIAFNNAGDQEIDLIPLRYVTPSGGQVSEGYVPGDGGDSSVLPGATTNFVTSFPTGERGGTIYVETGNNFDHRKYEFTVQLP